MSYSTTTTTRRPSVRRSLVALLLVLAGALTACNETELLNALDFLAQLMETPAPQVGMSVGSGG
jgi:hypothetical protein